VWVQLPADMSAGPKKRGFFFYIDDNIMDFVQVRPLSTPLVGPLVGRGPT